jgi:outer membrane murein-binding lipoprotein Lpp
MPLVLAGATSGQATIQATDAATVTLTLPATSGTIAIGGSTPTFTSLTVTGDASISGLTVGKGAGSNAFNTTVGSAALAGSNTGANNTAIGYGTLFSNTSGASGTAIGTSALLVNTTGSSNTAVGHQALTSNTTASNNTAVGYQAGYSNTVNSFHTYLGFQAGYSNVNGSYNTCVGYQAGFSNNPASTGNTLNTFIGYYAGQGVTTGTLNTFIGGNASGYSVTTGGKNTIIGNYTGNNSGLDIRTASNYIVLSDGDGNPRGVFNASGYFGIGNVGPAYPLDVNGDARIGNATANTNRQILINGVVSKASRINFQESGVDRWLIGNGAASENGVFQVYDATNGTGVQLARGATSWTAISDERAKDIIEPISNASTKVSTLRAVIGKYKKDEEGTRRSFLIAQDVQAVFPEAVDTSNPEELGVRYTEIIPLLVAAIQELNAKVTALEAQLGAK